MTPGQLYCYTEEVWIHATAALGAYRELQGLLSNEATRQARVVWVALQGFLTHAGMVSKLLFPPTGNKVAKERGKALCTHIGVTETSPLADRAGRNSIEHLDERMDNWLRGGYTGFLECVFDDRAGLNFLRSNYCVRRVLIQDEMVFVTQGKTAREEAKLIPLTEELDRVRGECEKRMETNSPFTIIHPNRGG